MIEHGGVWLPDGEQHLTQWMTQRNDLVDGMLTYQRHKQLAALELTEARGCMVDVGAHVGLWAMWMAKEFDVVLAFEPIAAHIQCLMKNCPSNVRAFEYALGAEDGRVSMHTEPTSSGDTYPKPGSNDGTTIVRRFDGLGMTRRIDLVKLDCEGFELFVLQGMREMLERDRPAIVVEQKPNKARKFRLGDRDAVTYLTGLGATLVREMAGDFFLKW